MTILRHAGGVTQGGGARLLAVDWGTLGATLFGQGGDVIVIVTFIRAHRYVMHQMRHILASPGHRHVAVRHNGSCRSEALAATNCSSSNKGGVALWATPAGYLAHLRNPRGYVAPPAP